MPEFDDEVAARLARNELDPELHESGRAFMEASLRAQYSYNFSWLGRPIIQYPQDVLALQEIFWRVQPRVVIETGIAHGGSLIFSASMLELNAACGGPADAMVVGLDIDIRPHNRAAIEAHPLNRRITMLEGSSIAPEIVAEVKALAAGREPVMVILDSNHTHDHVLAELEVYGPLTTVGSYCVVLDTIVEDIPADLVGDRPWGVGNSPKSAVYAFLRSHPEFVSDRQIDSKLVVSVGPEGYLRRTV